MNNDINNRNNSTSDSTQKHSETKSIKSKIFWGILFVFIAAFSIWAVVGQSKEFSLSGFIQYITQSFNIYLLLAFLAIFGFVFFEGAAVVSICRSLGYKRGLSRGLIYSVSDVYLSAITPSASGGQPASAYFMKCDGIPFSVSTVALIVNVIMYTLSVLFFGLFSFITAPSIFLSFDLISKILIIVGVCTQILLITLSLLVLKKAGIIYRFGCIVIDFLSKIRLIRKKEAKKAKLQAYIDSYRACSAAIRGKTGMLVRAFILNLLQRSSYMAVLLFSYLATGGSIENIHTVWATQGYITLGANSVPIPGSMGVVDLITLDGLDAIMDRADAVNLELLSRSISFYICIFVCGAVTLTAYLCGRIKRNKQMKRATQARSE